MKKIALLLLFLPLFSHGQAHIDLGGGAARFNQSGEKGITKAISPVVKIGVGYQVSNIVAEVMMQPTLTRTVNSPNYFGGKLGYNIAGSNLIASAGYFYNLCNSDNPENNGSYFGYSLKYQTSIISEYGALYAEAMLVNKSMEATIGFHIMF